MHVALLANTAWLDEELSLFHHLIVGLLDEQVRVTQVLPEGLALEESRLFTEQVYWPESRLRLLNIHRLSRMGRQLDSRSVNLIHALDGRVWQGASALAGQMNLPVIFSAGSHFDIKLAEKISHSSNPQRCAFVAATEPIGRAIREKVDDAFVVETILPGVHPGSAQARRRQSDDALCVVVSGNGVLDDYYTSFMQAIGQFVKQQPDTQFFFDGQDSDQHRIWQIAKRLNLLANMSFIPRRLGHREILLRADVLVHPQPLGRSRGLTLQAMARGIPIVAYNDPWLDYLIEDETAWVVSDSNPQSWQEYFNRLIDVPGACQELGKREQNWIRENRMASEQINRVLDLYRGLTGATIPFPVG